MARFRKVVTTAGKYVVGDGKGGRQEAILTAERFNNWVNNFKKLKSKGYLIPAPFDHDNQNSLPIRMGNDGSPPALNNAGFVDELAVETIDGVPSLVAVFNIDGDTKDPNSLAYKVGKTVKETSVYVRPNYLDGVGEKYEGEVPMHVALVTHAIEPGQSNFQPIGNDIAVAMSQRVVMAADKLSGNIGNTDDEKPEEGEDDDTPGETAEVTEAGGSIIAQLIKILRDPAINIDLPDDTNEGNFTDRLNVAARQRTKQPTQTQAPPTPPPDPNAQQPSKPISTTKPPRNAVEQSASLAMSQTPKTTEEQLAVVMSQLTGYENANKILSGYVTTLEREKRATRIAALISSGRVTEDYAKSYLQPALEGFQMSLGADGKPAPAAIDTLLVALEATPAKTGSVHNTMVGLPASAFANLPPEAANAVATVLMSMGGQMPAGAVEAGHPQKGFFEGAEVIDHAKGAEIANQFLKNVRN